MKTERERTEASRKHPVAFNLATVDAIHLCCHRLGGCVCTVLKCIRAHHRFQLPPAVSTARREPMQPPGRSKTFASSSSPLFPSSLARGKVGDSATWEIPSNAPQSCFPTSPYFPHLSVSFFLFLHSIFSLVFPLKRTHFCFERTRVKIRRNRVASQIHVCTMFSLKRRSTYY